MWLQKENNINEIQVYHRAQKKKKGITESHNHRINQNLKFFLKKKKKSVSWDTKATHVLEAWC